MSTRRKAMRLIVNVYRTDRCEERDLGRAALATHECYVRGWHITDDPVALAKSIRRGDIIDPEFGYRELGPGLYISAIPAYWASRSTGKWAFLKRMTQDDRKRLARRVALEVARERESRFITADEAERGLRSLDRWIHDPDEYLVYLAGQPYNIRFWQPYFLNEVGLGRLATPPQTVEIHAKGRFVEVSRTLEGSEWRRLARRFDGAYLRQGMSTDAQLVIWNPKAITFVGKGEPLS